MELEVVYILPASGKRVRVQGVCIFHLAGQRVVVNINVPSPLIVERSVRFVHDFFKRAVKVVVFYQPERRGITMRQDLGRVESPYWDAR